MNKEQRKFKKTIKKRIHKAGVAKHEAGLKRRDKKTKEERIASSQSNKAKKEFKRNEVSA